MQLLFRAGQFSRIQFALCDIEHDAFPYHAVCRAARAAAQVDPLDLVGGLGVHASFPVPEIEMCGRVQHAGTVACGILRVQHALEQPGFCRQLLRLDRQQRLTAFANVGESDLAVGIHPDLVGHARQVGDKSVHPRLAFL